MHSCATKDGRNRLTAAQWHGFVMVFIVKECLSVILEALLNLSAPQLSPIWSPDSWVSPLRPTESVNGIASEGGSPDSHDVT